MPKPQIACIGSIDSSGGAGINRDIAVASSLGESLFCCVGSITIQNENGVESIHPIPISIFERNLQDLISQPYLRYIKIGALCSAEHMSLLLDYLSAQRDFTIVLDPVILPSKGLAFVSEETLPLLVRLSRLADYVTPNLPELSILTGRELRCLDEAIPEAIELAKHAKNSYLIKGGHGSEADLEEALVSSSSVHRHKRPRRIWAYSHGTGCALATAFCCFLARAYPAQSAFRKASGWVDEYYCQLNARQI